MQAQAYMQYEHEGTGIVARWHGGEYIELGYIQVDVGGDYSLGNFVAQDVINVWDHAKDEPRIPRTLDALKETVDERIAETDDE